ncbi:MAG: TetR/AcrR family transcriptional regulator C-terminal domain-containing protein [Oscillospiraceae bacterium]|nr:TetR/AcrR family transcriptional regulator C-terminal domain-containing protein [Oscillospiraceae bacterium]
MPMKDRTKLMFADALEELLKTTTLEKLRVSHLCEYCGTTTPTFYYYFHDKYELVAWMFLMDFAGEVGDKPPGYSLDVLISMTKRMEKRKAFYQKAFSDRSQNSIVDYMTDFNIQIAAEAVKYATGAEGLSRDQLFALKYHNYGIMGIFRDWLFEGEFTVEEFNQRLYERTPDFLKEAFAVFPYSTADILRKTGKKTRK